MQSGVEVSVSPEAREQKQSFLGLSANSNGNGRISPCSGFLLRDKFISIEVFLTNTKL